MESFKGLNIPIVYIHTHSCSVMSGSLRPSWTVAHQAPLSMGFSRQEYWNWMPCPPPWDLPDPGTEPVCLTFLRWQVGSSPLVPPGKPFTWHGVFKDLPVLLRVSTFSSFSRLNNMYTCTCHALFVHLSVNGCLSSTF